MVMGSAESKVCELAVMKATLVTYFVLMMLLVRVESALPDEQSTMTGSNGHYSFHNQYQQFNTKVGLPYAAADNNVYQARTYQGEYPHSLDMIHPVRTMRTHSDNDVKIIRQVGGRKLNPAPIYYDKFGKLIDPNIPTKYGPGIESRRQNNPANHYIPISSRPRIIPLRENRTRKKNTIRFPSVNEKLVTVMNLNDETIVHNTPKEQNARLVHSHGYGNDSNYETPGNDASAASYVSHVEHPDDEVEDFSGVNNYDSKRYPYIPPIIPSVPYPPNRGGGFEKEGGTLYRYSNLGKEGEKTDKGHKSHESYHKGHAEKHGHGENKEKYADDSGKKLGHHHEANHYSKGHQTSSGQRESGNDRSKGHKKGRKTKGFHTVHHKDEYKKDEVFYDEEHDISNQSHSGHDNSVSEHAEGGKEQKGHLNSGYRDHGKENHSVQEEGHSYENNDGDKGQEGGSAHHSHHSHYRAGEGHNKDEVHRQGKLGLF